MVVYGEMCQCMALLAVGNVAHGIHDHSHGCGCSEQVCLGREDMYVGVILGHVVHHVGDVAVVAHQYGYVVVGYSQLPQFMDDGRRFATHGFRGRLVGVVLHVGDAHVSSLVLLIPLLLYIGIGLLQWGGMSLAQQPGEQGVATVEEAVVELHYLPATASVGVEMVCLGRCVVVELACELFVENAPVTASPAVYGLFHVTYDEAPFAV